MNKKNLASFGYAALAYSIISFIGFGVGFLETGTLPKWVMTTISVASLVSWIVTLVYLVKSGKNKQGYGEYQKLVTIIRTIMYLLLVIVILFSVTTASITTYALVFAIMTNGFMEGFESVLHVLEIIQYVIVAFWGVIFVLSIVCIATSKKIKAETNTNTNNQPSSTESTNTNNEVKETLKEAKEKPSVDDEDW